MQAHSGLLCACHHREHRVSVILSVAKDLAVVIDSLYPAFPYCDFPRQRMGSSSTTRPFSTR